MPADQQDENEWISGMSIDSDIATTLSALAEFKRDQFVAAEDVDKATGLSVGELNDAVKILEDNGYVDVIRTMGTAPYDFRHVTITAAGRYQLERAIKEAEQESSDGGPAVRRTPVPVGSPYGFTEEDWEYIDLESNSDKVIVTFGHQFESEYYDRTKLTAQLQMDFELALVTAKNDFPSDLTLDFVPLEAGYGEHLFNQIARSIIASDIAVFETSDRNPNVMIEMGVALTWGVRVHPIRHMDALTPPSDISGQTWARYTHDGTTWEDDTHDAKVAAMVKQVLRRKTSSG